MVGPDAASWDSEVSPLSTSPELNGATVSDMRPFFQTTGRPSMRGCASIGLIDPRLRGSMRESRREVDENAIHTYGIKLPSKGRKSGINHSRSVFSNIHDDGYGRTTALSSDDNVPSSRGQS
jgi:hypothetical protein